MAVQASKSISLTLLATGGTLKLSANNIVKFTASGSNTLLTYINSADHVITKLMTESVATVNTAAARTQAVTLDNATSTVVYIHSDKIIYLDTVAAGTVVTYWNAGKAAPEVFTVTEAASAINTAAGNTFAITTQPTSASPSAVRYINNLFVYQVNTEEVIDLPTLTALYKIKLETVATSAGGAGYTVATVAFSGGGPGAILPTATATIALTAVTSITIVTAGSNITDDVLVTISGDGAGALAVNVIHHILDTLTLATTGSNLNTAPIVTFSAGTVTALATIQVSASTQKATGTTITNVGSYLASAFPPTITIAGGAGAQIMYDEKRTGNRNIQVEETAATVQSAINAL